jgi:uncharacterized protein
VQLENNFTVDAPIEEAWKVLLDIERVAHCMPGATLDGAEGDEFTGRVKVKVGPIVITYQGSARFLQKDPGTHRAVIDATGKESRGSGTAKATVTTELTDRGDRTDVRVLTDLNITGRPAQFGRGVIADVAGTLTKKFAESLAEELIRSDVQPGAPEPGAPVDAPADQAPPKRAPKRAAPGGAAESVTPSGPDATPAESARGDAVPTARGSGEGDVIDLLGVSTAPLLKRLLPVLAALGALGALALRRRRSKGRS